MRYHGGRMSKRIDPHCRAFQNAVDLLARPWTGLILSLLQNGPLRFSELEEGTRGVGAKTLSARLKGPRLRAGGGGDRALGPGAGRGRLARDVLFRVARSRGAAGGPPMGFRRP